MGASHGFESAAVAQGPGQGQVGTESQTHAAAEGVRRRLRQRGVDERGARGIASQHRHNVVRKAVVTQQVLAQSLEILRRVAAGFAGGLQLLQVGRDVDTRDQCIESGQHPGHVDHARVPAAVAGGEQYDVLRLCRAAIDMHVAEMAETERPSRDVAGPAREIGPLERNASNSRQ